MKNLLCIMAAILMLVACSKNNNENAKLIQIDSKQFEFALPKDSKELDEAFKNTMIQVNSNILYMAICDTNDAKYLFMVSKYMLNTKTSIEEAFAQTVKPTTNPNTDSLTDHLQLIDYKTYDVQGKTIRYKISKHFDTVYTIMYYFMKDDSSKELYEIKTTANQNNLAKAQHFLEKVALSVEFK